MKASELMLGDYLYVWPSNMVIKVAAIHKWKVGYHACTNKLSWVRRDLLSPMPLDDEILTRNFEKRQDGSFIKSEDYYDLTIRGINDSVYLLEYENTEFSDIPPTTIGSICFVHELQHALRICGIDKTLQI